MLRVWGEKSPAIFSFPSASGFSHLNQVFYQVQKYFLLSETFNQYYLHRLGFLKYFLRYIKYLYISEIQKNSFSF